MLFEIVENDNSHCRFQKMFLIKLTKEHVNQIVTFCFILYTIRLHTALISSVEVK